ncbi:hypothetical protein ACJX0J_006744, partial [Zea mays]
SPLYNLEFDFPIYTYNKILFCEHVLMLVVFVWFQYKKFAAKVAVCAMFTYEFKLHIYWFMVIYDLFGNASAWQHVFF